MGPLDASRPWETRDVVGMYRFLQRLWRNIVDEETGEVARRRRRRPTTTPRRLLHRTIDAVRTDMEALRFNTAIAKLIELNNHLTKLGGDAPRGRRAAGADAGAARPARRRGAVAPARPRRARWPTSRSRSPTRRCWSTTPSSTRCRSTARCAATSRSPPTPTPATVEAAALADAKVVAALDGRDAEEGDRRPRPHGQHRRLTATARHRCDRGPAGLPSALLCGQSVGGGLSSRSRARLFMQ